MYLQIFKSFLYIEEMNLFVTDAADTFLFVIELDFVFCAKMLLLRVLNILMYQCFLLGLLGFMTQVVKHPLDLLPPAPNSRGSLQSGLGRLEFYLCRMEGNLQCRGSASTFWFYEAE